MEEPDLRRRWCDTLLSPPRTEGPSDSAAPQLEQVLEQDIRGEARDETLEEVGTSLLEQKLEESIPFVGEAIGVVLDNAFIHRVEIAAKHVFQERWLRDNGKVDSIAPTESSGDWGGALRNGLNQAAFVTGYSVGFGTTFPVLLVSRLAVMVVPLPIVDGLTEGAAANEKVAQWRAGANGRIAGPGSLAPTAAGQAPREGAPQRGPVRGYWR